MFNRFFGRDKGTKQKQVALPTRLIFNFSSALFNFNLFYELCVCMCVSSLIRSHFHWQHSTSGMTFAPANRKRKNAKSQKA